MQAPLTEKTKRENKFLRFMGSFLIFLLLLGVIVASFWISFTLGSRILVPARKLPERGIEVPIPEPPPEIAGLQKRVEVSTGEAEKTIVYKVNAGFFVNKSDASRLAEKLNASGFETCIKKVDDPAMVGKGWRVQVGAFKSKANALNLQRSLKAKGFESTLVYE